MTLKPHQLALLRRLVATAGTGIRISELTGAEKCVAWALRRRRLVAYDGHCIVATGDGARVLDEESEQ